MAAVALPLLVGFVALVAEFGHGLVVQAENQRTADLAAFAAAVAYTTTNSTSVMNAAAQNVALLNGVPVASVSANLVASPRTAASQAVQVDIATSTLLLLAPVLRTGSTLQVRAKAVAQIGAATTPCVLALSSGGAGVQLSGGSSVAATTCAVASNATLVVPCGTSLTAKAVVYDAALPSQPCSGITGQITKAASANPLAGNVGIVTAQSHASTLSGLTAPSAPLVTSGLTNVDFGYNPILTTAQVALTGCIALYSGKYIVTCPVGAVIPMNNMTVEGGVTVNFNVGGILSGAVSGLGLGLGGTTLNIAGTLTNKGTLTFGPANFNIAKGIIATGGARTTFANGLFAVGAGASACNGAISYSICNLGTAMTFGGPSSFAIAAGLYNNGGSTLTLGSGTGNALAVGAATDGNALLFEGGSTNVLPETDSFPFQLIGNVTQSGGTCSTFGIAAQHDITGDLSIAGGTLLGAGVYSIGGYMAVGANGGGDVACNGATFGVEGANVTLVVEGAGTISGGACNGAIFCVGAGFGNMVLSAPTSGSFKNLLILAPNAGSTGSVIFTEGTSNTTLAGALYLPTAALTLSGAATIGTIPGQCLQIVAAQINLSGGTKASASTCFGVTAGSASATLVQ